MSAAVPPCAALPVVEMVRVGVVASDAARPVADVVGAASAAVPAVAAFAVLASVFDTAGPRASADTHVVFLVSLAVATAGTWLNNLPYQRTSHPKVASNHCIVVFTM